MKKLSVILLLSGISLTGFTQKVKLVEGDLKPLKGQSSIKLQFTYEDMTIGKEGLKEQDYVTKKTAEYNSKEAGRGDKWAEAWVADRKERFEPQFTDLFEKNSNIKKDENSKYTLIFHTTRTEPGWNVGVMRAPARIDGEVLIVETSNPQNVVAKLSVVNAPGRDVMGFDLDTGYRLQEAYAKSGKEIGRLIVR